MATITYFRRYFNNFADDDQLLNTAVSFPIAFRKAYVYGAEAKLTLSPVHRFSGFVSYSYQVGSVYLPVTGGLFLGSDATNALTNTNGRLWDSQDQRHTLHARVRYQLVNRVWIAFGGQCLAANIENLNNRLNVIDFAGLFSGNAIAPPRSYSVRFQTTF